MNFDEFIIKYKRKHSDDLVTDYLEEVFGISMLDVGCAKNYFIRFEHFEQLTENFDKIRNNHGFVVQKEDLCVWGSAVCDGDGYAAIAADKGDTKRFYTCELSRHGKGIKRVRHDYNKNFLGVLRPKIKGK